MLVVVIKPLRKRHIYQLKALIQTPIRLEVVLRYLPDLDFMADSLPRSQYPSLVAAGFERLASEIPSISIDFHRFPSISHRIPRL